MSLASKDHKDQITIFSSFAKLRADLSTMATFCATITDYDNRNVHNVGEDVYKTRSRNLLGYITALLLALANSQACDLYMTNF